MSGHMTLLGADDVERAGRNIAGAAETMQRAADTVDRAGDHLARTMDEAVARFVGNLAEHDAERPTLRDYFIAHAPAEPQHWFEPTMPTPKPQQPPFPADVDRSEASYVREYASVMNPIEVKSPFLRAYVEALQAWRLASAAWNTEEAKERVLQWPAAWADEMLKRRSA